MENKPTTHTTKETGFALLMTILVVTVLLSIGISVLNLSIQQVQLSTIATDSEEAFHAANAGLECALFHRRDKDTQMEGTDSIVSSSSLVFDCFGSNQEAGDVQRELAGAEISGDGRAALYEYQFSWDASGEERCSQIVTIVGNATTSSAGTDLEINNVPSLVPGFPPSQSPKNCAVGTVCTIISSRGYNKSCNEIDSFGTVQREVLLQL